MKLKRTGKRIVHDSPSDRFGVYVWIMPNGSIVKDEEGNYLNIPAEFGNLAKLARIKEVAAYYNASEGRAVFLPGAHRVDEEEYEHQRERMRSGLVPDTEDIGSILDDVRYRNAGGK